MKYKFRIWDSDVYSYENAEEQLNSMAQQGYEFKHTINMYFPITVFKKSQDVQKTRYAIEMAMGDDEDFFQLCRDAGWEKGAYLGSDQYILTTRNPNAIPIFSDSKTKYESALSVAKSGNTGCAVVFMLVLGALLVFATPSAVRFLMEKNDFYFLILFGITVLAILTSFFGLGANYLHMKRIAKGPFGGVPQGKPKWIRVMGYSNGCFVSMFWLMLWGRGIWQSCFVYQSLLAVMIVIIVPLIGIACLYLSAIWNKRILGFVGMMVIFLILLENDSVIELLM